MQIERVELKTGVALDTLALFYGGRLGLSFVVTAAETLTVLTGTSELIFRYEHGFTGIYHFAFNVPENRLDKVREYLEKSNIALIADADGKTVFDFHFWDAHAIYIYDPSRNIVEFIARHELSGVFPNSDTAFRPVVDVQCISEVGLATADVPALAAHLLATLCIETYRESNANFFPIGNANGLFIVVSEGRVWYPATGIPAQILPVVATAANEKGRRFTIRGGDDISANGLNYTVKVSGASPETLARYSLRHNRCPLALGNDLSFGKPNTSQVL